MVNGLHSYSAYLACGLSKRFTILPNIHPSIHSSIHPSIHTHTHTDGGGNHEGRQPAQQQQSGVRASLSGDASTLTARRRNLSDLPVTGPPRPPPSEPPPPPPPSCRSLLTSREHLGVGAVEGQAEDVGQVLPFQFDGLGAPVDGFLHVPQQHAPVVSAWVAKRIHPQTVQRWLKHHASMSLAITPPFK